MVELLSPLGPAFRPGRHGKADGAPGVTLAEMRPGSLVQVAAFAGREAAVLETLVKTTGCKLAATPGAGALKEPRAAFSIAPGRWLVRDQAPGLDAALARAVGRDDGAVVSLAHGRTVIRVAGPQAEWVLAKLFAVDFAAEAFPLSTGVSTAHHDVFAAIQRVGENAFDVYVFRSFARSFFETLARAAEEVGVELR